MAPKKKKKDDNAPKVDLEKVMKNIENLGLESVELTQQLQDRLKDHADSLSIYDVTYNLSSLCFFNEVLYMGCEREIVGISTISRLQEFRVQMPPPLLANRINCIFVWGGILYAGIGDKTIRAWNATTAEPCGEFVGNEDKVNWFQQYNGDLMSASNDGYVRRWALPSQNCVHPYFVCEYPIITFEIFGDLMYCAAEDLSVRCVDLRSGHNKGLYKGHAEHVRAIAMMGRSRMRDLDPEASEDLDTRGILGMMYTGSSDQQILGWEVKTADAETFEQCPAMKVAGNSDTVARLLVLDVQEFVADLTGEHEIQPEGAIDPAKGGGKPRHHIPDTELAVLRDQEMPKRILISGSADSSVRLFDCRTGTCMLVLVGHTEGVTDLVVHRNVLYSASSDRTVRSWNLKEALVRIQMRRRLKTLEVQKQEQQDILEANSKKKKKGKKKK